MSNGSSRHDDAAHIYIYIKKNTLNNTNSYNNNFKYCFNKLYYYYNCKHLIVLIIVNQCHVSRVQTIVLY